MKVITPVASHAPEQSYKMFHSFLTLHSSGKENVYAAFLYPCIRLLGNRLHTIIYNRKSLSVGFRVARLHRRRYSHVARGALKEPFHVSAEPFLTRPEARVVHRPHYAAAASPWKEEAEKAYTHVRSLRVHVYDIGSPAHVYGQEPQRKAQCCDAFEKKVEAYVGHVRAVEAYARAVETVDELTCERRRGTHHLHHVIFRSCRMG